MEDGQLMVDHVGGSGRKTSRFTNGDNGAHPSQTIVPPMFILSRAEQVALQLFQLPAQPFQFTACLIQPVLIPLSGPVLLRKIHRFLPLPPAFRRQHLRELAGKLISRFRLVAFRTVPLLSARPERTHRTTKVLGPFHEFHSELVGKTEQALPQKLRGHNQESEGPKRNRTKRSIGQSNMFSNQWRRQVIADQHEQCVQGSHEGGSIEMKDLIGETEGNCITTARV